jgi:hypothetical protein
MNWKIGLALGASLVLALARCGSDDCTTANDQLASCAPPQMTASSSSSGSVLTEDCAGATLCKAKCVEQYSCSQILGNDPQYTACLVGCNGK